MFCLKSNSYARDEIAQCELAKKMGLQKRACILMSGARHTHCHCIQPIYTERKDTTYGN